MPKHSITKRSLLMFLAEMNIDDLDKLKQFRIERLLLFFQSSLPRCLIQIDESNMLIIYCPHAEIVDDLLDDSTELCLYAWLILGVREISLYFCLEEIIRIHTYLY
jgi:hypothetical protein